MKQTATKTRIFVLLVAVLLTIIGIVSAAHADVGDYYWDQETQAYTFTTPRYGIVICTKMNVRTKANANSKSYGQIKNGQPVKIIGVTQNADFYVIDLESCGFKNVEPGSFGYAKSGLIKINPQFIYVSKMTNLYSTPWNTEYYNEWYQRQKLKNGEQINRYFIVIDTYEDWYAVQTSESSPGTAFIKIRDVTRNNQYYSYYTTHYVTTWEAPLLDENTWAQKQVVKRFTEGEYIGDYGDYILMSFNTGLANEYRGYICKQYIAPIIN